MDEQELDKLKEYWVDNNYLYDQEADALIEAAKDTVVLITAYEASQRKTDYLQNERDLFSGIARKYMDETIDLRTQLADADRHYQAQLAEADETARYWEDAWIRDTQA